MFIASLSVAALVLAAGIDDRLARWRTVKMPFDATSLSARERALVDKLVEASRYMEEIFWRQADPEALALYHSTKDPGLRRLLMINGSRYDLIDHNAPFAGAGPLLPGRTLYPATFTRERVEQFVREHPEMREQVYSPFTVIRERRKKIEIVPYRKEYKSLLEPAARSLRAAADLSDDAAFAGFLRLRADALLSDDYYASDLAWLDLKDPKFDVIFGPYETYLDDLLGVKTSYSAAVLIRNETESAKLRIFEKYVPDIQASLPLDAEDRPSLAGHATPMEVMDAPLRVGDLRHGYQAVADNLPNDPRIHQAKGTKKIFFKNFMDARVNYVVVPLVRQIMRADQAAKTTGDGYLAAVILHEIAHGLGPAYARKAGARADIRESVGPVYAGLEEAKADVVGMFGLNWLIDHGVLPKERLEEYYASYVAGIFRTVRYGIAEAHGRAEMMEFNYLAREKAIVRDGGVYRIDFVRMPAGLASLAKELLEIEATGDRARAEAWFHEYEKMPTDLAAALGAVTDVPVDIDPVFDFRELNPSLGGNR